MHDPPMKYGMYGPTLTIKVIFTQKKQSCCSLIGWRRRWLSIFVSAFANTAVTLF